MATIESVKQALGLAKNLVTDIGTNTVTNADKEMILDLATEILESCKAVRSPEKFEHPLLPLPAHPVDALLKKGKVTLSEGAL